MTGKNTNTISHSGTYQTKIEKRDDGSVVIVQTNSRGICDCVILDPNLIGLLAEMIKPAKARRAA